MTAQRATQIAADEVPVPARPNRAGQAPLAAGSGTRRDRLGAHRRLRRVRASWTIVKTSMIAARISDSAAP